MIEKIALIASVTLPLWNIPLIMRVIQRKSSDDISLSWVLGVWVSFVLMAPQGLQSDDLVWKMFNISNLTMFSVVVIVVVFYRIRKPKLKSDRL